MVKSLPEIELKWQKRWEESGVFKVGEEEGLSKCYVLEMFPYPSGSGLHMGHTFNYTIGDIFARFKRMNGFNVMYPMGYDSFGLPAENAAIKARIHPKKFTDQAISNFIKQQKALGLSYDWDRRISTCEPDYYRWNQFFFLKFMENGLVYRKVASVNWCPDCNTVLANEQVHDGMCWRHNSTTVEQRDLEQWFIKTTKYSGELLDCVEDLDWSERIKLMQKNWIGRSEGVTLKFDVLDEVGNKIDTIETFTTRVDTVYGITYLVLAAEHPKVKEYVKGTEIEDEVNNFIEVVRGQSVIERTAEGKEKNGVFLGKYFINPFTGERCPLWVADYALYEYGTGAVMAVPAHDQRDFDFAQKYKLPIKIVISSDGKTHRVEDLESAYEDDGLMVESEEFNGVDNQVAKEGIADFAEKMGWGERTTNYKLRDWLISRQRYWGTPIPVVHCESCGIVPVPVKELPVVLPDDVKFGEGNPLETNKEFVNAGCPACGGLAKRETDTMDTFFDSSWYFLRYCDSKNVKEPFEKDRAAYWMPVDQYIGGAEHATMHLIYARFFTKALRDMGLLDFDEPFKRLFNQGMIHGGDGHVMSKSRGNVVNPTDIIEKYSADSLRFFLVSIASPNKDFSWSDRGIESAHKFVWRMFDKLINLKLGRSSAKVESKLNKAIKECTIDIEGFRYNYAIQKIRALFESFGDEESPETIESFVKLLHPICPHLTEEIWERLGKDSMISLSKWPEWDESKIDESLDKIEDFQEQTMQDIRNIVGLVGHKPLKITLFMPPDWKYEVHETALKHKDTPKSIMANVMKNPLIRKQGKEGARFAQSLAKNPGKLVHVLGKNAEKMALEEIIPHLEGEFGCAVVLKEAVESSVDKAKQAAPLKPAVYVE